MTKEERDALIASARKTPWLDTMKRRETEALLEALDDAEKRAEAARRMLDRMADESHVFNTILENTQQERDEARAALGTWEAWDAEHHGGVRAYVAALEADQRRLVVAEQDADEARAQLAALHAAASAYRNCDAGHDAVRSLRYEPFTHPETGETLYRAGVERPTFEVLDRALADAATAAREHEAAVRAPVEAERDQLAAALAEVWREASATLHALTMALIAHDGRAVVAVDSDGTGRLHVAFRSLHACLGGARLPLPANLAAQRESRIRADERVRALREAADALEPVDGNSREVDDIDDVPGWLRKRAEVPR